MPFHVRDPVTNTMVRELARKRGIGITEAIKLAVGAELEREAQKPTFRQQIRELQADIAKLRKSDFSPDKAFFDSLSGEED